MATVPPSGRAADTAWRGWSSGDAGPAPAVTSKRLAPGSGVANRWFPKIRSWFALGAPLELLSPLSVLRVVFVLAVVVWPLLALPAQPGVQVRLALIAVTAVFGYVLFRLLRARLVGPGLSFALTGVGLCGVAVVVSVGGSPIVAAGYLLLTGPLCVFAALFLPMRRLAVCLLVVCVSAWVAAVERASWEVATAFAVLVALAAVALTSTIALVSRSARRTSAIDSDTGLPNGYGLEQRMTEATFPESFVLAVVCLLGLAEVREAMGYSAGTELLRRAVEDLGQVVPAGALIGRVEGDELVVVQPLSPSVTAAVTGPEAGVTAAQGAAEGLAALLLAAVVAGRYLVDEVEISLGARVGLAVAPWDGTAVAELLRRAAQAARRAVTTGQAVRRWDGARDALTADDLALLADLRLAAGRGELRLAYQPQVSTVSVRTVSVEALLRWDHPTRGPVPPDRFIPLAERTGFVDKLSDWALGEALDAQVRWRALGINVPVSVNLSAKELSRPDLPDRVLSQLRLRDLPAEVLTVEITETAAASVEVAEVLALLKPLQARGVRISVDDFGTGYTSLSVLPILPLHELKVDLGFVSRSAVSPGDDAITRTIPELAHRLGLIVVAEGVEDAECAERMTRYGFDLLQGYYFSAPLTEPQLIDHVGAPGPAGGVPTGSARTTA